MLVSSPKVIKLYSSMLIRLVGLRASAADIACRIAAVAAVAPPGQDVRHSCSERRRLTSGPVESQIGTVTNEKRR